MPIAVTLLQLDTGFPRISGDVACRETYRDDIEVIRVRHATVTQVVNPNPQSIDIAPFENALMRAKGDIVVTSCGFLSYWQDHLAALIDRPFTSSALTALSDLSQTYRPGEVLTVTFDSTKLIPAHFGPHQAHSESVVGLPASTHLRQVIGQNHPYLDVSKTMAELCDLVQTSLKPHHRHLLLECTNLPPYKAALQAATGLPVTDILTQIEKARAGTVHPKFLG